MSNHPRTSLRPAGSQTAAPNATHGSQTALQTDAGPSVPRTTLRLRAEPEERPRVQWAEDVVDNEGMGKKSSKVCCIYHKPHEPGDSDSESDSSSSSEDDSDSEPDLSRAHKAGGDGKRKRGARGHRHEHDGHDYNDKGKQRKASPNAYERQPKHKSKGAG